MPPNIAVWDAASVTTTHLITKGNPNMKTNHTIITKSIANALPIALLAASLTFSPWTASARERGGATFAERQPSFATAMREHSGPAFAERQPSFAAAVRAPEIVREPTVTIPKGVNRSAALSTIESRLARLDAQLPAGTIVTEDVRLHRDRIARTREYLYGLVDLGTPDWEIDAWTDALWQNEILAGMPSDLVLDYWGDPIANDSIVLAGGPAAVWTYRLQPGKTEQVTVASGAVRSVRRL
jgi:hypothetical protein